MFIDLAAIRKRDGDWHDDERDTFASDAARDRRVLLDYIDELQLSVQGIASELGIVLPPLAIKIAIEDPTVPKRQTPHEAS